MKKQGEQRARDLNNTGKNYYMYKKKSNGGEVIDFIDFIVGN